MSAFEYFPLTPLDDVQPIDSEHRVTPHGQVLRRDLPLDAALPFSDAFAAMLSTWWDSFRPNSRRRFPRSDAAGMRIVAECFGLSHRLSEIDVSSDAPLGFRFIRHASASQLMWAKPLQGKELGEFPNQARRAGLAREFADAKAMELPVLQDISVTFWAGADVPTIRRLRYVRLTLPCSQTGLDVDRLASLTQRVQ